MANQARSVLRAADLSAGPGTGSLGVTGGGSSGGGSSGVGSSGGGSGGDRPAKSIDSPSSDTQVVVKKYANRRLYNTESSSYITLDSLAEMVRAGRDFVVFDAKTGEDITRSVLTQIIVEEESKGAALLPTGFLRQLISFYGDSMQGLVPRYLEQALNTFGRQQQQMRVAMQQTMGNFFPFGIEEMGRQNMAMMERAMSLFAGPFYRAPDVSPELDTSPGNSSSGQVAATHEPASVPRAGNPSVEDFLRLQAEVESLRDQLAVKNRAVAPEIVAPHHQTLVLDAEGGVQINDPLSEPNEAET